MYAIWDMVLEGYKAGLVDTSKEQLMQRAKEILCEISQVDAEPVSIHDDAEDVLRRYQWQIVPVEDEIAKAIEDSDAVSVLWGVVDLTK